MRIGLLIGENLGAVQIVQELDRLKAYAQQMMPRMQEARTAEDLEGVAKELDRFDLDLLDVVAFVSAKLPDERTIRRRIAERRPPNPQDPWTLAEADGDEGALILPVLAALMERTEGRVAGFTREQAQWVVKVRRAAPDLEPLHAWEVAFAYQGAVQQGREADRASLDALLAFAPWRSDEARGHFWNWIIRYRDDWYSPLPPPHPGAPRFIVRSPNVVGLLIATRIVASRAVPRARYWNEELSRQAAELFGSVSKNNRGGEQEEQRESPRKP
jgi:hypothetical protein